MTGRERAALILRRAMGVIAAASAVPAAVWLTMCLLTLPLNLRNDAPLFWGGLLLAGPCAACLTGVVLAARRLASRELPAWSWWLPVLGSAILAAAALCWFREPVLHWGIVMTEAPVLLLALLEALLRWTERGLMPDRAAQASGCARCLRKLLGLTVALGAIPAVMLVFHVLLSLWQGNDLRGWLWQGVRITAVLMLLSSALRLMGKRCARGMFWASAAAHTGVMTARLFIVGGLDRHGVEWMYIGLAAALMLLNGLWKAKEEMEYEQEA